MRAARRPASEWKPIVATFRSSGLSRGEFCQEHGIRPGTFKSVGGMNRGSVRQESYIKFLELNRFAVGAQRWAAAPSFADSQT